MSSFRQNAAIVYSRQSLKENIKEAQESGKVYRFEGTRGLMHWLAGEHAYLAVNGLSSILRRLGVKFDLIFDSDATEKVLQSYNFIFVPDAPVLSGIALENISKWTHRGGKLIVSGRTNIDLSLCGVKAYGFDSPSHFIGIKWKEDLECIRDKNPFILSCPQYTVNMVRSDDQSASLGKLVMFTKAGNRTKGGVELLEYDAIVITKNTIYFAPPIFEYIGALLQGHISFEPARKMIGKNANFYIDTIAFYMRQILIHYEFKDIFKVRHRVWGNNDNVLILRHDSDSSRDTTYLNYELKHNITSTYPIKLDNNCRFWLDELDEDTSIETAFHFSTTMEGFLRYLFSPKGPAPSKKLMVKDGIIRQAKKAAKVHGFNFSTVHRHGHFFYYPETVEALDSLFGQLHNILGSQTMFRYIMYKYIDSRFSEKNAVSHPDTSIPFWFPFKLFLATIEEHRELRGWECTEFIEPDEKAMDLAIEGSKLLPGGVYTMGFHPAHTRGKAFNKEGNYKWFLYCVEHAQQNSWWIANYKMVLERLNDWQNLRLRILTDRAILYNDSDREIKEIFIENNGSRLKLDSIKPQKTQTLYL